MIAVQAVISSASPSSWRLALSSVYVGDAPRAALPDRRGGSLETIIVYSRRGSRAGKL